MSRPDQSVFTREIVGEAVVDSFRKLDPRGLVRNPVIFVVELGAVITSGIFVIDSVRGSTEDIWFVGVIAIWLWLTVLFANFSEAIAEGRGKAQANALRATRTTTMARLRDGREVPAPELQRGDVVIVEAGEVIPADGEVIEGVGSVDESAITGESAPVIREAGGDRSAVTGGTRLLSDRLVVEVTQEPGGSFLDRMIALVEGAERRKTPNEIALNILIAGLTIAFLVAVVTLKPFAIFAGTDDSADRAARRPDPDDDRSPALGDRDRGHGSARPPQRPGDVRSGGRGLRRRGRAPARQDGHDHARQPAGGGVHPGSRRRAA
jgi:K+-transporting ATPase ATPase B chain